MGEALTDKKKRLRRSMLFLNAQKPSLIRDAYLYGPDSLMFDLEEVEQVLDSMKLLGCKGTTGTQASFLDLFNGDPGKASTAEYVYRKK